MTRTLIILSLLLFSYLFILGWSAVNFASYSIGPAALSLENQGPHYLALDEPVTLELQGTGFDDDTRVFMHMDVNNRSAEIASLPIDGSFYDMEIVEDYLYLAGNNGVRKIDISNPLKPRISGSPHFRYSPILDIEKSGKFLYLSCGTQGMIIAEMREDGRLVSRKKLPSWTVAMASKVVGDFLYVAASKSGLLTYDLNSIEGKEPVARVETDSQFRDIEAFGNYLYVASREGGVLTYDVSASGIPEPVGQIPVVGSAKSVTVADGYLYILEHGKVSQFTLVDPSSPQLVSEQRHFGSLQQLYHAGDSIYVSDNHNGLGLIDNRASRLPDATEYLSVGGDPRAVVPVGEYLYVAVSNIGIKVLDTKEILPRQVVSSMNTAGVLADFVIIDNYLYTATKADGLKLRKLSAEDENSRIIDSSHTRALIKSGSLLYSLGHFGVKIFDVSTPANPALVATWPQLNASHAATDGDYLVLASESKESEGLMLIRGHSLGQPKIIDRVGGFRATKVFAEKGLVVSAGNDDGVRIYRIENDKLTFLSSVKLPYPLDKFSGALNLIVVEKTLFVANGEGGLLIVDIESPERPVILSLLSIPGYANSLLIEGDKLFVTSLYSGLHTIDISNLRSPRLLDTIKISDLGGGLQIHGDMFYLDNRYMGVTAIPVPHEVTNITQYSAEKIAMTIPPPKYPGRYSLEVSNKNTSVSLDGVLRYQ